MENLITRIRNKKKYEKLKIKIENIQEDIVTSSNQSDEEKEKWMMHLMYRDCENSTSLEEKYDDYPPLETPTETDAEKIQEKIQQSKKELEEASKEIENELN